uniref:Uncharacterized protein n=1 Tax=Trypanosoma congolense (strain IL3000) TaxID=1068625 RepID=G0UZY2_TRYCI|nr:hypothetical protein, unlikely [Trypanosoma congolense IL3000]
MAQFILTSSNTSLRLLHVEKQEPLPKPLFVPLTAPSLIRAVLYYAAVQKPCLCFYHFGLCRLEYHSTHKLAGLGGNHLPADLLHPGPLHFRALLCVPLEVIPISEYLAPTLSYPLQPQGAVPSRACFISNGRAASHKQSA